MAAALGAGLSAGWPVGHRRRAGLARAAALGAVDAAALVLRPGDLAGAEWRHDGAFYDDLAAVARNEAAYRDEAVSEAEVARTLEAAGWRRYYAASMSLIPASATRPSRRIRSYVTEYLTPDGATQGFAYLEDERGIATASDLPGTRTFGEQSELTRDSGISATEGRPYRSLDLTFRAGALVAGLTLIAYGDRVAEPAVSEVEELGAILEQRVAGAAGSAGALGTAVVRLAAGAGDVVTYDDAYYRLAGVDIPLADEDGAAGNWRIASYGAATDVYQLWQGGYVGTTDGFLYGATLLRFADGAAASGWLERLPALLGTSSFYGGIQAVDGVPAIGEQTVALRYAAGGGAGTPRAMLIAMRLGRDVTRVHLVPQGRTADMPLAPAVALAQESVRCLGGGSCVDPIALPPGLLDAPA